VRRHYLSTRKQLGTFAVNDDNRIPLHPQFVATALGFFGRRVDRPNDLAEALRTAFTYDGPALVQVMAARQEFVDPGVAAYHFTFG
jgi:thiamine pyrophosphate-dependent acetolactate synthase large subunit-like protein